MDMKLKLNGIGVDCVIGERPDERTRLQHLRVDVELQVCDAGAARWDWRAATRRRRAES